MDGLIIQSLLKTLGINESCMMRCDYWHLINKVFLKDHNFGSIYFGLLRNHSKKMLLSDTIDEWETAYKDAKHIPRDYPLKLEN